MSNDLSWRTKGSTLILQGKLDCETLLILWNQRKQLLDGIHLLDVSNVHRVDSSGIALLFHFYYHKKQQGDTFEIIGITDKLRRLIALYNLQTILPV